MIISSAYETHKLWIQFLLMLLSLLIFSAVRYYIKKREQQDNPKNHESTILDNKILNTSGIVLLLVSLPALIFSFIIATAISNSILLGIICALIFYGAIFFRFMYRIN
jgi:predicted histidine transporter YuiF (NhaC family)